MEFVHDDDSLDSWLDASLDYTEKENGPIETPSPTLTSMWNDNAVLNYDLPEVYTPPKKRKKMQQEPRHGSGRKPLVAKHLQLFDAVETFVKDNGFKAHERRRVTTGRSCGTSLKELKSHIVNTVEEIEDISESTLRRMMKPPSIAWNCSKRYSGLVDAKVAPKRNDVRKGNPDAHYYCARVRYRLEFAMEFEEGSVVLSADCMNKINVGGLAVSRYHQVNKIYPANDAPNVPDHDFPVGSKYKLTPSGYMQLKRHPSKPKVTKDKLGRDVFAVPRSGPAFVFNRAASFRSVSIQSHVNELLTVLKEIGQGKKVLVLIVDGGPDWNSKSLSVAVFAARLFREANLDVLCMTTYGPGQSALNPIEHLWAPLSRKLTSVILPAVLPGDTKPPSQQSNLTEEERRSKEATVFDAALERLSEYWHGTQFDGYSVSLFHEKCKEVDYPFNDYSDVHEDLKSATRKKLEGKNDALQAEIDFITEHCDRRTGELTLLKCTDKACDHCNRSPPSSALLKIKRHGGMPTPVLDKSIREESGDHYYTYNQAMERPFQQPDEKMVAFQTKGLGKCDVRKCRYVFASKKDATQHSKLFH